jgi:tripartite-type tricarboxylate transporter receptor subunit TctC
VDVIVMLPRRTLSVLTGVIAVALSHTSVCAQSAEDFYRGKTVTMVISAGVGEGFDSNARLIARHLGKHIPGNPTVLPKNMPGAGHVLAANYMASEAPRDGTVIASIAPAIITHQLLEGRGVRYDIGKFAWLGASDFSNQVIYVWAASGVKLFNDLMTREVVFGGTGAGSFSVLYPALMNTLMGTKIKIVTGYKAAREIDLAMERGEVEGRAGNYVSSLRAFSAEWLAQKKINLLAQVGRERDPDFADVPLLVELAKSDETRRVLNLFQAEIDAGRPFLTTPGVPSDRLDVLRQAFEKTVGDPELLAEAAKARMEIHPLPAGKLQAIISDVAGTPADVIALAKRAKDSADNVR